MSITTIITGAAKVAHVSGALLLAICSHESNNFTLNYNANDKGTPSIGVCQVKLATARLVGFKGKPKDLMNASVNGKIAAMYLKYQQNRYGSEWLKLASAYNAGSYSESSIVPGCPKNLKYVKLVQKKLPVSLQKRLNCGEEMAEN